MAITTPFTIKLLKFETLEELTAPDLTFGTVDSITDVGPLVYVLIEGGGGIVYVGKSDAKSGAPGKRGRDRTQRGWLSIDRIRMPLPIRSSILAPKTSPAPPIGHRSCGSPLTTTSM